MGSTTTNIHVADDGVLDDVLPIIDTSALSAVCPVNQSLDLQRECTPDEPNLHLSPDQCTESKSKSVFPRIGSTPSETMATPQPVSTSPDRHSCPIPMLSNQHILKKSNSKTTESQIPTGTDQVVPTVDRIEAELTGTDHEDEDTDYLEFDVDISLNSASRRLTKNRVRFADPHQSIRLHPASTEEEMTKKVVLTIHDLLGVSPRTPETVHSPPLPAPSIFTRVLSPTVLSGAENSWFAAWSRKSPVGGQKERAETLLHYSDLSWRRMKKVMAEVNVSGETREGMERLFKKYPKGRYLERKGITLEEYDDAMHTAWISCWQNMNDSLQRFAKSPYYTEYLANMGQISVRTLPLDEEAQRRPEIFVAKEDIILEIPEGDDSDLWNKCSE